jgi:hypothetical protein
MTAPEILYEKDLQYLHLSSFVYRAHLLGGALLKLGRWHIRDL